MKKQRVRFEIYDKGYAWKGPAGVVTLSKLNDEVIYHRPVGDKGDAPYDKCSMLDGLPCYPWVEHCDQQLDQEEIEIYLRGLYAEFFGDL
jgi:hypothetical protein